MRRYRWMVLGVVLTAALSVAAIAAAKGIKISERSEDFTVAPFGDDEADCGGKRAVAGGFFGDVNLPGGPLVIPLDSTRESESEWRFRALDIGGGPADATAYAYCAKKKKFPKLREASEDDTATGGVESVTAECPGNRRAISGGFELPDAFALVTTSMRSGRGSWTVEVYIGGGTVEVEAFVYCAKGVKLKQRSSDTTLSTNDPETEEARCKRKERVVSGGWDTESDGVTTAAYSTTSRRTGKRSWEATATAAAASQPLNVYAYCLKQPKKK
jgi:hypothetical protein